MSTSVIYEEQIDHNARQILSNSWTLGISMRKITFSWSNFGEWCDFGFPQDFSIDDHGKTW